MKVLVTGELTYLTKHFVKQLVEDGHELRYRENGIVMQADDPKWDWLIRGDMVYPQQQTDMPHMTLQMASKQWQKQPSRRAITIL